ncbi:oligopeptidase A [Ketobacter sp. MCCC 1A13808]|uniref:oligopeptidase A n=1 Tax=Ketobacter sp. MCCC 1A13808 TaxID=2602738 RepID=UPI0012EB3EE7|nr:oligopeptidase A [Ketobacter sp. MCCC 1A13808]MVF14303.1 oligopeptidase A [Ketobacter sp. MCCC 1A13808]
MNSLLESQVLPLFSQIQPEQVEPAISQIIERNHQRIAELVEHAEQHEVTLQNFLLPFEELNDDLSKAWSPVSHLNSVMNNEALRNAYNACLPKLSEYSTVLGQHQGLYKAYKALKESPQFNDMTVAQKKVIDNALRDFHLSGIDLPKDKQVRYGEISKRLSELTSKFSENVLDCTNAFSHHVKDEKELSGLPETQLQAAKLAAEAKQMDGYLLTLDIPVYIAVMTYCDNRDLRKTFYEAYNTKSSECGPFAGQWDNNPLMDEILALRHELAVLLGFNNYAERSIATKMTETTDQVLNFLYDLSEKALPAARKEVEELQQFAALQFEHPDLQAWDVGYFSEKLKHQRYAISQEALRPWFPLEKVLSGLFEIATRLFGVTFEMDSRVDVYHNDVRFYRVYRDGEAIAGFYLDLYARANKRGGAWMDVCRSRRRTVAGELQKPIAYLTCNFNGPVGEKPALLTHSEVTTLFHEFGHGLHHMLTRVEEDAVSGIAGVAWDAVELPSQFLENWCWEKEAIPLMSGHFESGEPLPDEMLEKMLAAKNFQSAMMMVRQLEFSIFDFRIHLEYQPGMNIHSVLQAVRERVSVISPPEFNRFECSFSHIFAGGYAAGYYSYKWAEVLSADAFSRFEEEGIFNSEIGRDFRQHILEMGGSEEPMALFKRFRGREPKVDALLRHSGLTG